MATARQYLNIFEGHADGVAVFEHLVKIYCARDAFVRGGVDAERQTTYHLGQRSVVDFMQQMCDRAKTGDPNEEQEL